MGASGTNPEKVAVSFSRNIAHRTGRASSDTKLRITPPVDGELKFTSRDRLEFIPNKGFKSNTSYEVELLQVDTGRKVDGKAQVLGHEKNNWVLNFKTPKLALHRLGVKKVRPRKGGDIDIVFTGPVRLDDVRKHGVMRVGEMDAVSVSYTSTDKPNVVRAKVGDPSFSYGVTVHFSLSKEVRSTLDKQTARASSRSLSVPSGDIVKLYDATPKEGARGFTVDVVCSDAANSKPTRYYWSRSTRSSHRLSNRCQLSNEALADSIHFTPAVKNLSISLFRGGFRLHGDFKRGTYKLRIDSGATSVDGGVVHDTFEREVVVPAKKPRLTFSSQGRYLPKNAANQLSIRHLNVDDAELEIRHIQPHNVHFWLSDHREDANQRNSELIAKKKLRFDNVADQQGTTLLNLQELLPKGKRGVVHIRVRDKERWDTQDSRRIVLTDLNLVAKKARSSGDVVVWAFDMKSTEPQSGVTITQKMPSGKVVSTCTTSRAGSCILTGKRKDDVDDASPSFLWAQKGDDFTYLKYDELRAEANGADVWGESFSGNKAYTAAVYTDRGVYRPGDTSHVVVVVRDKEGMAPQAGMPVKLEVKDPRRKVFKSRTLQTNAAGMVFIDLPFGVYADTGRYSLRVDVSSRSIAHHSFNVEEFVPERMKVEPKIVQKEHLDGDEVNVDVSARYLFGGSAKGSRFELSCSVSPTTFQPKENGDYRFAEQVRSSQSSSGMRVLGQVTGKLGDEGTAQQACPRKETGSTSGPLRLSAQASVFEAGSGRTTVGTAKTLVHPEKHYVGLKASSSSVEAGKPIDVDGIIVDWAGKAITDVKEVKVELLRLTTQYGWTYDEWSGHWRNRYHQREERDTTTTVKVGSDGKFKISLVPQQAGGRYVVRVSSGKAQSDMQFYSSWAYSYWWDDWGGSSRDKTPRPKRASALPVSVKGPIEVGQPAEVSMKAPFPGTVLLAVETDGVITHDVKTLKAGPNTWSFTLEKFAPNVYVSALLIKDPHLDTPAAFLPDRAYGMTSVRVQPRAFTQDVQLTVPNEVRSNSTLNVELQLPNVEPNSFVTVAAVDEGILSLTKFKSPDPLASIFKKRALGVDTFETIGWNMLLPAQDTSSKTGGDADASGAGRVQQVKPVALYSGVVKVPKDGKVSIPLEVPEYRGALRVMVVSVGPKKVGTASKEVLVRDPIVLQSTLPRFLMENDEFDVPVFVTNLSGKPQKVDVSVDVSVLVEDHVEKNDKVKDVDALVWQGKTTRAVQLADGESKTVRFSATAKLTTGAAHVVVKAKSASGIEVKEERDIPFSADGPLVRKVQRVQLKDGVTDVLPLLEGWTPTTERTNVWVTNNPYGDAFDHLRGLMRYPHGCLEQTTSKTRPLLFLANLVSRVDPGTFQRQSLEKRVMAGVNRVLSMQTSLGGFAYWPGGSDPSHWASAYATHMLLDAIEQGYPVPKERVDNAVEWMERELTHRYEKLTKSKSRYRYYKDAEAYFHYVVARAGKGRKARILKLLDDVSSEPGKQARESEWLLKTALHYAGDRRFERDLKKLDASPIVHERSNSWSFYSELRRRGMQLALFGELFDDDPAGEALANVVASELRRRPSYWYTTQELVWSVTGLGRRVGNSKPLSAPPRLEVNGRTVENKVRNTVYVTDQDGKRVKKDTKERSWNVYRASEAKSLKVSVDDDDEGSAWLILSSEGQRPDAKWKVGGEGLRITRKLYDTGWNLRAADKGIDLGEVLYVAVTVENTTNKHLKNIAVVDRLPAGFEIENPRLNRQGAPTRSIPKKEKWTPDFMNLRDDRVEVFGSISRKSKRTFIYAVRATGAGTFRMPPVSAEAMYDPALWARQAGGLVEVLPPWDDRE